jgi:benzoyl-CoA reductase/2-hydroxyglutaryl-CoA dehydratase subunit BcrC/BadD/HgdB
MNFLEREIAKYERRIKRIRENPDPSKAQSNLLLYEMFLDHRKEQLRAAEAGEPFVYVPEPGAERIILALGVNVISFIAAADRAGSETQRYLRLYREMGYPPNTCDRVQVGVGLALSGDIPQPSLIFDVINFCDPFRCGEINLARHFGCPYFFPEGEEFESSEDTLRNMARQLEEFVAFAEENIPGAKFDKEKLRQLQEIDIQAAEVMKDIQKYMKSVPAYLAGQDVLRMGHIELRDHPRYLEYMRMLRDELEHKAESKQPVVLNEKLRFFWLVSAPFFYDPFEFLAKRGVSVPMYEASQLGSGHRCVPGDDSEYGRHLNELEEESRIYNCADSWAGLAENRVKAVAEVCRDYHIDGIVHFQMAGCHTLCGSAIIVGERIEKEMGIPSLYIEGYCLDQEKFDQAQFEAHLDAFVLVCLRRKEDKTDGN